MAGQYQTPTTDQDAIRDAFRQVRTMLDEVARMDAGQLRNDVARLQALIDGILTQVNGIFTGYVQAGTTITAAGDVTSTGGRGVFVGGLTSLGAAGTNVTLLPGSRSQMWLVDASGVIGQTTSSVRFKTDIQPVPYTAAQYLSVMPLIFKYIGQLDIRNNPDNENYDPGYVVPTEVGMVAEHLIEAGLPLYVLFEQDGVTPTNIDYPTFGAHAALVIGHDHEDRLRRIEEALTQR